MTEKWTITLVTKFNDEIVTNQIRALIDNTEATEASFHKDSISEAKTE